MERDVDGVRVCALLGWEFNRLNAELNPISYLLALLGAHHFLHVSLRPLTCRDRGFESHRGHGYLPVVSVVCFQVEVSATS